MDSYSISWGAFLNRVYRKDFGSMELVEGMASRVSTLVNEIWEGALCEDGISYLESLQ